ncbi:MAG: hypothetical protein ACRC6N_00905 [Plesiomonas sp.]|uniref:hypothetical protein n=1 Tax=Plesiomonas sp. TaxID=2486279 RepID=UPI003F3752FA
MLKMPFFFTNKTKYLLKIHLDEKSISAAAVVESADTLPVSSFYRACTEPQSEPGKYKKITI